MLFDRFNPIFNAFESFFICHIIRNYDTVCFLVKWIRNCMKSFLSSCIPYFYRNIRPISLCCIFSCYKIKAQCRKMLIRNWLICVSIKKWSFADSTITEYYQLNLFPVHFKSWYNIINELFRFQFIKVIQLSVYFRICKLILVWININSYFQFLKKL